MPVRRPTRPPTAASRSCCAAAGRPTARASRRSFELWCPPSRRARSAACRSSVARPQPNQPGRVRAHRADCLALCAASAPAKGGGTSMSQRVVELLRSMDLFGDLDDSELSKIARLLKEHKVSENEVIFNQGDPGDGLYIILQGRVRIATTDSFGRERVLAFYGPGEFFGDMAVLTGAPRSASASVSADGRLLQLRKDDFDVLVATNVGVMRAMMRVMVERQAAMNTRVTQEVGATEGDVRGQVTVLFSPRGGTGQTVLATNLGVALAELTPDRVVAVDLDLLFGHMALLLDLVPRTGLAAITPAAIRALDRDNLAYYLTKHPESSLRVLSGTLRPEESELVTGEHVRAIIEQLRRQFVHIVIDAGSRFSEPCLAAIEAADQVIVVTTPEASAGRATQETQRVLRDLL